MYEMNCDVAVIGGGPAGLAAAISAKETGAEKVLIIERDCALGGILQQCIHPGFGLTRFHEELTGPEYYGRFVKRANELGIETMLSSMVLEINTKNNQILATGSEYGLTCIKAGSIVISMGCREKTRASIMVPGTRPAGLYTAGSAQRLANRQNILVGKKIVILGSGDIGMIMARRMTLEGAKVVMVIEIMDYLAGLTRNRVQCLDDFGIPLKMSHTITRIVGNQRVEGVYIAPVDDKREPILAEEEFVECDTVLFSVGLMPENELTRQANIEINPITNGPCVDQHMQTTSPSVFACGNVVHVNDLVDNVSRESEIAGKAAALYSMGKLPKTLSTVTCVTGTNVRYLCPQCIHVSEVSETANIYFRVLTPQQHVRLRARCGEEVVYEHNEIRVNPGEMNHVTVNTDDLTGDTLTVEVIEED